LIALRTSSSLKGLMTAQTSFIDLFSLRLDAPFAPDWARIQALAVPCQQMFADSET
jgi:hypothetical protein